MSIGRDARETVSPAGKTMCRNLIQYDVMDAYYQEANLLQFPRLCQRLTHFDEDSTGAAHDA